MINSGNNTFNHNCFVRDLYTTDKKFLIIFASEVLCKDYDIELASNLHEVKVYDSKNLRHICMDFDHKDFDNFRNNNHLLIHMSQDVKELMLYPETSLKIWVDEKYTSFHSLNSIDTQIENLYIVHNQKELEEMINFIANTAEVFYSYDTEYVNDWERRFLEGE